MRHTIIAVIVAIAFTLGAPPVSAQERTDDQQFVTLAAIGGLAEVQLGRLAVERAGQPSVQHFGERMVLDHGALNAELSQIAGRKGMSMPLALDDAHQQKKERLARLWGHDFDRAYMQEMVDHIKNVAHFEAEAQTGTDPDLKGFATAALPVLRQHLDLARSVNTQVVLGPVEPVQPAASPRGAPTTSWCDGAHAPTAGTNFGACIAE